jgi:hypothetical protein
MARIDGVIVTAAKGSVAGASTCGSGAARNAIHHTRAPTPASSRTTLTSDHSTLALVGAFPISGSCGQLFV